MLKHGEARGLFPSASERNALASRRGTEHTSARHHHQESCFVTFCCLQLLQDGVLDVNQSQLARLPSLQALSDKALGGGMILVALVVFAYYTTWAILLVCTLRLHTGPISDPSFSLSLTKRILYTTCSLHASGLYASPRFCSLSASQASVDS